MSLSGRLLASGANSRAGGAISTQSSFGSNPANGRKKKGGELGVRGGYAGRIIIIYALPVKIFFIFMTFYTETSNI